MRMCGVRRLRNREKGGSPVNVRQTSDSKCPAVLMHDGRGDQPRSFISGWPLTRVINMCSLAVIHVSQYPSEEAAGGRSKKDSFRLSLLSRLTEGNCVIYVTLTMKRISLYLRINNLFKQSKVILWIF